MEQFSFVRGTRMRVTRVDECGIAGTGADDNYVTKGFITVGYSPEMRDRDEIEVNNAGGEICVTDTIAPELKWYDLSLEFCKVAPEIFEMLTGQTLVEDYAGTNVGVSIGSDVVEGHFALEVWSKIAGNACEGSLTPYGYTLVPFAGEGVFSDFTIENGEVTFTIDARTFPDSQWGTGPYDVVEQDAGGTAGPLIAALAANKQLHLQRTLVAPPAVTP